MTDVNSESDAEQDQPDCNLDGKIGLKDDCNQDGVLDKKDAPCCRGAGRAPAASVDSLYDAYLAMSSGMTKSQVMALVPVSPSQGASTDQELWV